MRRPAPSPRGSNHAGVFLPAGFPPCSPAAAYDEASPPGFLARACKWMAANGCSTEDIVQFIEHMDDGGEVEGEDDGHGPTESQHNAMEAAAHQAGRGDNDPMGLYPDQKMTSGTVDRLPSYGPNGMPENAARHAMDETLRNCRRIPRGPIGWA
jgi:hypothetical protein